MSGVFASLSAGRAWEKLTSFMRAFLAQPAPSSSTSSGNQEGLEELMKMERTMRRIRAVLHDADEHWNIREESSKLKLQELKEVAYDMEDVVDEYEYEVNRCKIEALERDGSANNNSSSSSNNNKRKRQEAYAEDMSVVAVPNELVLRARRITERFNEIIDFSDRFTLSENDGERRFTHDISDLRRTSSFVFEESVLGREQDKEEIVEKILSVEGKNVGSPVSVMPIVGMGGLGKTTLAQLVYNSPRVSQSFDKHAWVCVSEPFSVSTITRNIIKSLTSGTSENTELAYLQRKLIHGIKDKKVLLVLDDVWNERRDCWDLLCKPMSVATVCQIIVTTRSQKVAKLVQTVPMHHLSCLTPDKSWSLFKSVAFPVDQESNTPENLIEIGKRIVGKCKGLPLAIKAVGSMLRYENDEKIWDDVLESELLDMEQTRNEVLPVLMLCYKHMPTYLKRCFIALSLYQKDSSLVKWEVIRLWKFLDLLHINGSEDEEEIGNLYLKELVQRSILQVNPLDIDNPSLFILHDLYHDLACSLSDGEFHRLEGELEIPQNVRYIYVPYDGKSVEIPKLPPSVRAFLIFECKWGFPIEPIYLESLFLSCKNLRALCLTRNSPLETLPNFIGSLKLVRHLEFEEDRETQFAIPTSLFPLYNLQTLVHGGNKRNLALHDIGRLINLRTLDLHLSRCGSSCNIRELRSINKIRELRIRGLGNVLCIEDANEAQMSSKKQLRSLMLEFTVEDTCCQHILQSELASTLLSHEQLLGSLKPHSSLTELTIRGYESHRYPSWLGNDSFSKLTRITLMYCGSKHLPQLGGLPSLRYLNVLSMQNVEHIGREFISSHPCKGFPSLTNMTIDVMENWLEWSGVDAGDFVRLQTLSIIDSPKLKSLPTVTFMSLKNVGLRNCGIATVPKWPTLCKLHICGCDSLSEVPTLSSLLELVLDSCPKLSVVGCQPLLTSMILDQTNTSSVGFDSLPSLTYLQILGDTSAFDGECDSCIPFYPLPLLESLEICRHSVTCLHLTQQGLPSLTRLCLSDCPYLQHCNGLGGLTSLQHLEVRGCPKLPTNSLHLPQLKTLIIEDY